MAAGQKLGVGLAQSLGGSSGAASNKFAQQLMLKQYGSSLIADRQLQNTLLQGGVGFEFDPTKGEWTKTPSYADTPGKIALGKQGYLKQQMDSYKSKLEIDVKKGQIATGLWSKVNAATTEENPEKAKILLKNLQAIYQQILPEYWKSIGGKDMVSQYQRTADVKTLKEDLLIEGMGNTREKFIKSRKLNNLKEYAALYQSDPKFAKASNFKNPEDLEKQYISDVTKGIQLKQKEDEAKIQSQKEVQTAREKKKLPMTTKQVNDALFKLVKAKAQLKAGKGLSEQMRLLMTAMNPKALAEFGGDPKEAIEEIDRQIEYYRSLLNTGKVQSGLRGGIKKDVSKQRRPNETPTQYLRRINK